MALLLSIDVWQAQLGRNAISFEQFGENFNPERASGVIAWAPERQSPAMTGPLMLHRSPSREEPGYGLQLSAAWGG